MNTYKKATWYGMEGKSPIAVYMWYRKQFAKLSKNEIFGWQVEPGTIGEKAQADAIGVSLKGLQTAKNLRDYFKVKAWDELLEDANSTIISAAGI